ncbi:MAG: rod shape-determining protein MreC [Clostridia bacterium]|nr:rod shape-determining protein MreC [Clostridia bacterium]
MKDFFRQNGILVLVIALLLSAITAVASMLLGGFSNPLSNVLGIISTPVQGAVSSFAGWVEGVYNYSFEHDTLTAENEALRKQVAELEEQAREGQAASRENERLRLLLELREKRRDFDFESATVVSRSSTNWASTLTISKGSAHGVAAGDCVIDETGALVGVVSEVGLTWSTLITVIDAELEMGGLVERTESAAIIEGDFALMTQGFLKLSYLPENTELLAGDLVVTSGKGGIYPSGLVVGAIESIHTDPSGMSRYAVVSPRAVIDRLVQVYVIKEFDIIE